MRNWATKSMEELVQGLEELIVIFEEKGIKAKFSIDKSFSDFGNSAYLYIRDEEFNMLFKFRNSDHGFSNQYRMQNELNMHPFTLGEHILKVERFFFPERFEEVRYMRFGAWHYLREQDLEKLGFEYEVDESYERVASSGAVMKKVKVKNVKELEIRRVKHELID